MTRTTQDEINISVPQNQMNLFRHGDRAPRHLYPKDPNKEDCWPEGLGKLTSLGKKQQYALGKFLRSRYQDFITTNPNEVLVNSSAAHRCLTSAEATMASFYAPEGRWKIYDDINWQPIPIHYLPLYQDKYLSFRGKCPRAIVQMMKQLDSEEMQEIYKKNQVMFEEISNYVGMNISQGINALHLYDTLLIEKTYNLTIPEWAYLHWEDLRRTASTIFRSLFNSSLSLRLRAGPLLQDIDTNMKKKINGNISDLKVQIYSAHDINLSAVLLALNFSKIPRPPYCSTLLFELHEMPDDEMAVRLLYLNSTDPLADMGEPRVLVLDGCSEFCPVENFTRKFQHLIPENWEQECLLDTSQECLLDTSQECLLDTSQECLLDTSQECLLDTSNTRETETNEILTQNNH